MRKQPKQDRSRALVAAAVEATARILGDEGRERLTTNRVAQVAGISVGSLYQYFPNKDALVSEVRRHYADAFDARFRPVLQRALQLPLRQALWEWVHVLVEIHAENPRLHNELGAGTPDEARGPMLEAVAGYLASRSAELRRPDPRLAARLLLQTSEALIHEAALRDPELLREPAFATEVCDLLVRYLVRDGCDASDAGTERVKQTD